MCRKIITALDRCFVPNLEDLLIYDQYHSYIKKNKWNWQVVYWKYRVTSYMVMY